LQLRYEVITVYFIECAMLVVFLILGIVPLSFASDTTKSVSESRLQNIAGNDAENCGHVHFGTDSKKADLFQPAQHSFAAITLSKA
jgi:hypothetical protein